MATDADAPLAVLLAVQLPGVDEAELASSLDELQRLVTTLGLQTIGRVTQKRRQLAAGKVVGDGKLEDLATWTGGSGRVEGFVALKKRREKDAREAEDEAGDEDESDQAIEVAASDEVDEHDAAAPSSRKPKDSPLATVVVVDHELTPTQQRNLERATKAEVLDRTSVILEIFSRHAKSREARLQVEVAKLKYLAPRLREGGGGEDRVRGGVGGKGAGETSLELDRRRIRDRIAEVKQELARIEGGANVRRHRRHDALTIALVGYTNAGKSSLMRALTSSEIYVADKLFATLDTTVRALHPRSEPPILVTDTVGFIKKLPHDLVASFRSTLDEANEADLLLHVVDAADPAMLQQFAVTREVLAEIGADTRPSLLVLNKADQLSPEQLAAHRAAYPDAVLMSARSPQDVARLRERIIEHFAGAFATATILLPWADFGKIAQIRAQCQVLSQQDGDAGAQLELRGPAAMLESLAQAYPTIG
ncbi:MAG: GTPase HflX [Myxococcales bacterium]|nr:GTPase HflX [Myxococcales bacterium]